MGQSQRKIRRRKIIEEAYSVLINKLTPFFHPDLEPSRVEKLVDEALIEVAPLYIGALKVKDSSEWKYAGNSFKILDVTDHGDETGPEYTISLEGTEWASQHYTIIPESECEEIKVTKV